MLRGLRKVSSADDMTKLVRAVIQQSLQKALTQRSQGAMERARDMRRATGVIGVDQEATLRIHKRIDKLNEKKRLLLSSGAGPHDDSVVKIVDAIGKLTTRLVGIGDTAGAEQGTAHTKGEFSARLREIVAMLTATEGVRLLRQTSDRLSFGLGKKSELDSVITPSWNPSTTSKHRLMWRHLEFGTGVFARARRVAGGFKEEGGNGSWWFGPRPGVGLHLRGSPQGALLREASGIPYRADALTFELRFARSLQRALLGRG